MLALRGIGEKLHPLGIGTCKVAAGLERGRDPPSPAKAGLKASIAKILGVTRPTIHRFIKIKTRRLRPQP
jgi:hypothetical protein